MSPRARRQLCRASFRSLGQGIIEMAMAWWLPPRRLAHRLQLTGTEHISNALAAGHSVLLIGAHFTTLDLVGRLLAQVYPLCVTYRNAKNKLVNAILTKKRAQFFAHALEREQMRAFLRLLKQPNIVWYAPDQDYGAQVSVFAPFFHVMAATIQTTAKLAAHSPAVLVPASQRRLPNGRGYAVEFGPPLTDFPSQDPQKDAARINMLIEAAILQCPEQYLWQHRRFKTRPPGEPSFYLRK